MTLHDFLIGTGPDFMITSGKMVFPHRALLHVASENGAKFKTLVTNPSLSRLSQDKDRFIFQGFRSVAEKESGRTYPCRIEIDFRSPPFRLMRSLAGAECLNPTFALGQAHYLS